MSHCFYVGNCIGVRNARFFVLFLMFGFLKVLLGFGMSIFAAGHSFVYYEIYNEKNFEMALFLWVGVLQLVIILRQRIQQNLDTSFAILISGSFVLAAFSVADFSISFSNNFFSHLLISVFYVLPLVFFYLHLRTAFFLIYHGVN